mgnify:CR=1
MKKLLAIILVAVLSVSCEKEIKDPIRIALEEYYDTYSGAYPFTFRQLIRV